MKTQMPAGVVGVLNKITTLIFNKARTLGHSLVIVFKMRPESPN